MFQIVLLFFIVFSMYTKKALIFISVISVIYLYWFSKPLKTPVSSNLIINADKNLSQMIKNLEISLQIYPNELEDIKSNIKLFMETYILIFSNKSYINDFNIILDKRKEILNIVSDVTGSVPLNTRRQLDACLWKYIGILINKYDLSRDHISFVSMAANNFNQYDLF